jgi:type IV secretory pathway VirB4 component
VAVDVFDTSRHANANGAILGKSGYGKTFTAQLLAIRMRLQNIQTFIITPIKGMEDYKHACDQIDGQYVRLGPGSPHSINIMDIRMPDTAGLKELDGNVAGDSLLAKKVQDLHTFFHLIVRDLTQEEEQVLDGYIYRVYGEYGITEDNDSLFIPGTRQYKTFPLLGDVHNAIKDDVALRRVYNILIPMVEGSLSVYNRHTNVDLDNKYIVFDMGGTKGQNLSLSMFVTLDFVWSKIKENRLEKKAVFIDEAWQLMGSNGNEMSAEYVKEIFKTIRAFGGAAFVMTQEVNDFFALSNGAYGKAIIGNADTKICLRLDSTDAEHLIDIMTLTNEEFKEIRKQERGNGMVFTGNSKLFVQFKASAFETDVITTDPEKLRKKVREAERRKQEQQAILIEDFIELDGLE